MKKNPNGPGASAPWLAARIYIQYGRQVKRQARRGSQLVLTNVLTFLFQYLSSDLEYFYSEAAGGSSEYNGPEYSRNIVKGI